MYETELGLNSYNREKCYLLSAALSRSYAQKFTVCILLEAAEVPFFSIGLGWDLGIGSLLSKIYCKQSHYDQLQLYFPLRVPRALAFAMVP